MTDVPSLVRARLLAAAIPERTGDPEWYWRASWAVFGEEVWTREETQMAVEEIRRWCGL